MTDEECQNVMKVKDEYNAAKLNVKKMSRKEIDALLKEQKISSLPLTEKYIKQAKTKQKKEAKKVFRGLRNFFHFVLYHTFYKITPYH